MVIYENKVKGMGADVNEFRGMGLLIIFGENAPEEIRDCCYSVSVNPIHGTIQAGQTLRIDDEHYRITAVGSEAPVTLEGLGHCTFSFNGQTEVDLPGTIYVEERPLPELHIGTIIQILEE